MFRFYFCTSKSGGQHAHTHTFTTHNEKFVVRMTFSHFTNNKQNHRIQINFLVTQRNIDRTLWAVKRARLVVLFCAKTFYPKKIVFCIFQSEKVFDSIKLVGEQFCTLWKPRIFGKMRALVCAQWNYTKVNTICESFHFVQMNCKLDSTLVFHYSN